MILSLDLIADWPGITPEAADEVRGVKAALDAKDKPTMMAKAARAATLLAPFPNLATAIMDAVSHAAQLF